MCAASNEFVNQTERDGSEDVKPNILELKAEVALHEAGHFLMKVLFHATLDHGVKTYPYYIRLPGILTQLENVLGKVFDVETGVLHSGSPHGITLGERLRAELPLSLATSSQELPTVDVENFTEQEMLEEVIISLAGIATEEACKSGRSFSIEWVRVAVQRYIGTDTGGDILYPKVFIATLLNVDDQDEALVGNCGAEIYKLIVEFIQRHENILNVLYAFVIKYAGKFETELLYKARGDIHENIPWNEWDSALAEFRVLIDSCNRIIRDNKVG